MMPTRIRSERTSPTPRRLLTVVAAVGLLLVGAVGAQASPPTTASGTITQEAITGFDLRFAGPNVILEQTTVGTISGTLTGSFEDRFRAVIHPNGRFNAQGTFTCQCTVDGKSGVLEFVLTNSGEELNGTPTFDGRFVITGGSGELSGLRGVLEFAGSVDLQTGLSTSTYSGQIHSHP
jgi:hypothetical protein